MKKRGVFQILWLMVLFSCCVCIYLMDEGGEAETLTPTPAPAMAHGPVVVNVRYSLTPVPSAAPQPPSPSPTPIPTPFCIYWVSDTQYYSYKTPAVFQQMARWMVDKKEENNALFVVNTGDIVDNRKYERHWRNANSAIELLNDKLDFLCVAGNHDVGADMAEYDTYNQWDFCDMQTQSAQYRQGECWYMPFTAGGTDFLLLGIGWQVDTEYLDWCEEVLDNHDNCVCIILVHNFLNDDGTLSTNGKRIEQRLIAKHDSVRLVLCGHNDGSARWQKEYGTRTVNAMMYNFQDDKKYGLGYMRLLMFNPLSRNIAVTTYSPYLDDYNYYRDKDKDTFTLIDAF